jgi:hypothetical protein
MELSFSGKCMEMDIIMLNGISHPKMPNITCSDSFVEFRPKMMMMMMMGHVCERGMV